MVPVVWVSGTVFRHSFPKLYFYLFTFLSVLIMYSSWRSSYQTKFLSFNYKNSALGWDFSCGWRESTVSLQMSWCLRLGVPKWTPLFHRIGEMDTASRVSSPFSLEPKSNLFYRTRDKGQSRFSQG